MRKLPLLVLVLALTAAACSGGGTVVASVNGTSITLGEVEALRPETATVERQAFADDLFQLIVEEVVRQGGRGLGVVEDQAAIDTFYTDYVTGVEAEQPLADFLDANGITEVALRHFAFTQVYFPEVQAKILENAGPVSADAIQTAYDQLSAADKNLICTRHILVATQEEGEQVVQRLDEGEDFGELAAELSTDTVSAADAGNVGCSSEAEMAAGFAPSFADAALTAPIGEVFGPFESQFGFHVLIVDSRTEQALDDMRDQLEQQLSDSQANNLVNDWFLEVMGSAEVVVGAEYGVWQTEPDFGVVAPAT